MKDGIRLQKYLAGCGIGSRRACERLITSGKVMVNGEKTVELGTRVVEGDVVEVEREQITSRPKRYFLLNKPKGKICVDRDHKGRTYVVDLIPEGRELGLFPVGRLDLDTTGLILLTNDGEIGNRIAHPRYGIEKEYRALIKGRWTLERLRLHTRDGVILENGSMVTGIKVLSSSLEGERSSVVIRIHEGRKHVVRRIFLSIGSRVYELERTRIAEMDLGGIGPGEYIEISRDEVLNKIG